MYTLVISGVFARAYACNECSLSLCPLVNCSRGHCCKMSDCKRMIIASVCVCVCGCLSVSPLRESVLLVNGSYGVELFNQRVSC